MGRGVYSQRKGYSPRYRKVAQNMHHVPHGRPKVPQSMHKVLQGRFKIGKKFTINKPFQLQITLSHGLMENYFKRVTEEIHTVFVKGRFFHMTFESSDLKNGSGFISSNDEGQ